MKRTSMRIPKAAGLRWSGKRLAWIAALVVILVLFWLSLPSPLFKDPYATVVYDRQGRLLGARIAADGQWRFPPADSVSDKFTTCLLQFEDRYFYRHPGFNPVSLGRAFWQNMRAGKIVSGGSTLSMQTIRLPWTTKHSSRWRRRVGSCSSTGSRSRSWRAPPYARVAPPRAVQRRSSWR